MESANRFLDKLVQDFVEWATDREACRSIILYGSAARSDHPADKYADRDILAYVHDIDSEQYLEWMRQYAPVWLVLDQGNRLWIITYEGGHIVHLGLEPLETLQELIDTQDVWFRRSYKTLLDKDNLAAKLPLPEKPIHKAPLKKILGNVSMPFFTEQYF